MASIIEQLSRCRNEDIPFNIAWREAIERGRRDRITVGERLKMRQHAQQLWATEQRLPIWFPTEPEAAETNLSAFMAQHGLDSFETLHRWSTSAPGAFWSAVVEQLGIKFSVPPQQTLDIDDGVTNPKWFVGARMNIAKSCLQGNAGDPAIVVGEPDGTIRRITYGELQRQAHRVADGLTKIGLGSGSRVAILMPMTPDSVALYLGLLLAGCTAVSIADSFAASEISRRLTIAEADAIVCLHQFRRGAKTIDLYERVLAASAPRAIVIGSTTALRDGDLLWDEFLSQAAFEGADHHPDHPINILFSSGTTGDPKAIVWDQTTPIKAAADGWFHQDIRPGDVVVWPTNLGWMMGPWLIFASLINRATIGLYGDAPSGAGFGRFVQDAKVTMLGLVPTLVRGWRASQCMEALDWSSVRCFSSTGEASNADDMTYLSALAGFKPIIEYCGGTEIGGGYITSTMVQPNVAAAFSTPALGNRFVILGDNNAPADEGQLYLVPPCVGLSRRLLNRDHWQTYYADCPELDGHPPLRRHGDHFCRLDSNYYVAGGRADDTMNLGGIKIGSAEIESVLNRLDNVSETAAIGVPPAGGGPDQLVVYAVLASSGDAGRIKREMNRALKSELNPLFRVSEVVAIGALPRTASNKVMRRELRRLYKQDEL